MTKLTDALTARDAAREKVETAAAHTVAARQTNEEVQAELGRRGSEHENWVSRQSAEFDRWTRAGRHGPRPALAADAKAVLALQSARDNAAAAAASLQRFEAAERESRQALAVAEAAVEHAVRADLTAEGDREAEEILRDEAALEARRNKLRGLRELVPPTVLVRRAAPMEGDWMHMPMHELRAATLSSPLDRLHTPVSKIGTAEVDPAAVEYWQARRAGLLSSEELPPSSAPEERAA